MSVEYCIPVLIHITYGIILIIIYICDIFRLFVWDSICFWCFPLMFTQAFDSKQSILAYYIIPSNHKLIQAVYNNILSNLPVSFIDCTQRIVNIYLLDDQYFKQVNF